MSVIGRLDDQVNTVIIKPLAGRSTHEAEAQQMIPSPENADASDASETHAETPESAPNKVQDAMPLPVWLL